MKKLYTLIAFLVIATINAQAPQGFNYQATVRNSSGELIINQNINFKFNIMLNSSTSVPVYSETHYVPTDDVGQVNLTIGTGTPTTVPFSSINWGSGTYYLGIELNTGAGYVAMGTTQLLSVPYALYANTSGSTSNGNGFTHYIGELYGGGIVVSLWKDSSGTEHGLIASLTDLGPSVWSNVYVTEIGIAAQSGWNGLSNSNAIVSQSGHSVSAAQLCLDYSNDSFDDWYLPSNQELGYIWSNLASLNNTLQSISGASIIDINKYWSSTEINYSTPYYFSSQIGLASNNSESTKDISYFVRAYRKF
jgi:hypothetical protein